MYRFALLFAFILLLFSCDTDSTADVETQEEQTTSFEYDESIELPNGFKAAIVADDIGRARHIAVHENGNIYVQLSKEQDNGSIAAMRDEDGDAKVDQISYFGSGTGTGIAIRGNQLFASSDEAVFRYDLPSDGGLTPDESSRVLVAGGFPEPVSHGAKSFAFDNDGNLYVNVGSPSNACMEESRTKDSPGMMPCPELERHAGIWKFKADGIAQQQQTDGERYATGIRNSVAVTWNPTTNNLFVMQHGRDQLHSFFPEMYSVEDNEVLPSEELLSIEEGDDFGWPYCYFDHRQDKKLLAPEYGGDAKTEGRCADVKRPTFAFPGHMAPNALLFYTGDQFPEKYKNGAFIAFHGSWNRAPEPQEGYFVAFVPMMDGVPSGDWEIFADNFAGMETVASPKDAQHRPTGLAQGADGSIYVTDSVKGKIWRIVYEG